MPGLIGNLGLSQTDVAAFASLTSNFTLANVATAQQALNASANGAVSLGAGTAWFFDASYLITNTGITSHTWAVLFGGTATLTSGTMQAIAVSSTSSAVAATSQGYTTTLGTALVVTAASVSATENVTIFLYGRVNINAAGTFIPQVQMSVASAGVQTMLAGSFFRIWPAGPASVQTNGQWS